MIKPNRCIYMYAMISIVIMSCDQTTPVLAIKNKTKNVISGTSTVDRSLTDSDFYNDRVNMNILLKPGQVQDIGVLAFKFGELSDTSKLYLYIFNDDSLQKHLQLPASKGVLEKALTRKVVIKLNELRRLDTIYVK